MDAPGGIGSEPRRSYRSLRVPSTRGWKCMARPRRVSADAPLLQCSRSGLLSRAVAARPTQRGPVARSRVPAFCPKRVSARR